jgi:hypothetical protein
MVNFFDPLGGVRAAQPLRLESAISGLVWTTQLFNLTYYIGMLLV